MNERLLTPKELDEIHRRKMREIMEQDKSLGLAEAMVMAVEGKETKKQELEAQDAKTLKEVGEWLDSVHHYVDCLDTRVSRGFLITEKDILALKQGKMPEGG